jgi:hypothetical protein
MYCMYVYLSNIVCLRMYAHVFECVYEGVSLCTCVCICMFTGSVCKNKVYVCMYVYICMRMYVHVCIILSLCIYVYMCMYAYQSIAFRKFRMSSSDEELQANRLYEDSDAHIILSICTLKKAHKLLNIHIKQYESTYQLMTEVNYPGPILRPGR